MVAFKKTVPIFKKQSKKFGKKHLQKRILNMENKSTLKDFF